jgi:serine-type D-Ala-D-Ala carboxypeptidase (penicillin-binding protein 5/6)
MRRSLALLLLAPVVVLATAGAARADQSSPVGGPALAHQGVVASGAEPPQVYAQSWVLADATTGEVLAAKNAHLQHRPASTLKTLTAITLLPRLDKRQVYEVQWEDAAVEGSAVGIVPGATYTIDQLFYGLMLPSGNDAAHALASAAGGMRYTVGLMQDHAEKLQALDTVVRNPSGLDADGQYTSAYDLALFARAGLVRADFRRYVGTVTTAFPGQMPKHEGKKRPTYQIYNQNPLLYDGYRGAVGVKTGYTTLAGRTFVGAAERDGHLLIVSLMGIVESSETAAQRLLDWGFAHRDRIEPVGELVGPVARGEAKETATAPLATSVPTGAADAAAANGPSSAWSVVLAAAVAAALALGALRLRAARRR